MIQTTAKEYIKNPYPGIRSFETGEGDLFFGREQQTYELIKVLTKSHFIAITGASGSGKSSLVKAGLIPELNKILKNWSSIIFRPGNQPVKNMADTLIETFINYGIENRKIGSDKDLERIIKGDALDLVKYLEEIQFSNNLLIYVDQFEEIFRYRDDEYITNSREESEQFVNLLIGLSKQRNHPIYVVLSMRSDFLSDCTEFKILPDMINEGHYLIPKMTLEEKEEAINGPAEIAGAKISDALKALLRMHILEFDVGLPVLQHALMRTWDYWLINAEQEHPVDIEHYTAIGTVTDALSVHAEQIYGSLKNTELKKLTEKLFKSLTLLGEDNRGTRRPARLDEICKITEAHEEDVVEVIEMFRAEGNSFLMPPLPVRINPSSVIDISHESIMRVWKRLVTWVSEETESAQLYLRLSKSAELYQEGKTGLLVNPDLQLALKWKHDNNPNETWALRYDPAFERTMAYLEYSRKEYEKAVAAKEERQKRNLKRAKLVALFMGAASIVSISFLIVALNLKIKAEASEKKAIVSEKFAITESRTAEEQKKEAISHKKIAEQQQMIADEERQMAEEQKLYALEQRKEALLQQSLAIKSKGEAEESRDKAKSLQSEAERLRDSALFQKDKAEKQKLRAEFSEARTDTLRKRAIAKSLAIQSVKLYQDNQKSKNLSEEQLEMPLIMAFQAYYFNVKYKGNLYDPDVYSALSVVSNSSVIFRGQNIHTDAIRDIVIPESGKYFITCSDDGTVKQFSFADPEHPVNFKYPKTGNTYQFRSLAFSPDEKFVAAGTYQGRILVWNIESKNLTILDGHSYSVNKLFVLKKTSRLISVSSDGYIRAWNLKDFQKSASVVFNAGEKFITALPNYDESRFAVASEQGNIRIFNSDNFQLEEIHQRKEGKILSLCWNKQNDLIVGYSSGKIEIINENNVKSFFAHASGVTDIHFDNQVNRMITCGYDGKIKIWNFENLESEPTQIEGHLNWIYCLAANNENSIILSGSADKSILLSKINVLELKSLIRSQIKENMSFKNWLNYVGPDIEYSKKLPVD